MTPEKLVPEIAKALRENSRPIPGIPGYYAATDGSIISESNWRGHRVRIMQPEIYATGHCPNCAKPYLRVRLTVGRKRTPYALHVLIAKTFLGPKPAADSQTRHLDGNSFNNYVENLAWGTGLENAADREQHGNTIRGSRHKMSKLTEGDVKKIKDRLKNKESKAGIARIYRVDRSTISQIHRGLIWKQI